MNFQRLGAWFLKDSGKKFVFGSAIVACCGIGCIHIVPHTFLLQKYKEVVQLYHYGFTVPMQKPLLERFNKVLDLLEIEEVHKKQFQPFMICGFNIGSAGTFYSRYGVVVGLPINFTYLDSDYIDKSDIQVLEHGVPWESDVGEKLLHSLQVSEPAQLYAIAREIQMRQTPKYFIDLFSSAALFIAAYSGGNYLNQRYDLYSKSRGVRFAMYSLIGAFALANYYCIKDATQVYYERKTDEFLKTKNPVFHQGGKEFYESVLEKHIALRSLMGKVGTSEYTACGNHNYFWRQRGIPLVQRKSFFEDAPSTVVNV